METSPPRIRFTSTLAFRFSIFFLMGILIIFIIAFYLTFNYTYQILISEAQKDASHITDLTITRIENILKPVQQIPITLSQSLEVPDPNYQDIITICRDVVIQNPLVYGSCLAFEPHLFNPHDYWYGAYQFETKHGIRQKILGSPEYDYFNLDWYRLPKLLLKPVWTEPYYDVGGGDTMMCTFSVPFYSIHEGGRRFTGVLTLDISLSSLMTLVQSVRMYQSGFALLVSRKGKILNVPDSVRFNPDILQIAKERGNPQTIDAMEKMIRGNSGFVRVTGFDPEGRGSLMYYAPIPSTGWSLALVFPVSELFSDLIRFLWQLLIIFSISVAAILIITILITRKFTQPISRLVDATYRIGQGNFDLPLPLRKSKDEISLLTNSFLRMKEELRGYIRNLKETTIAKEKMERELIIAHDIQMGMLPRTFPNRGDWSLHAVLESARAVGGDFYDYFFPDDGHLCIAIGDVSGKGVPAALFMSMARTLFRAKLQMDIPFHQVIDGMNRELCRDNPNQMFVTFFGGILDIETGKMICCNAGHNPPFLIKEEGTLSKLETRRGIPLGINEHYRYNSEEICLHKEDAMVLFTDGVTDAEDSNGYLFGSERLTDVLRSNRDLPAHEMTKNVLAAIRDFASGIEQSDDITLLILRYKKGSTNSCDQMKKVELQLWNQLGELERIVKLLDEISEAWHIPSRVIMEVNLVLEELFANIVFYAFDDGLEHQIQLSIEHPDEGILDIRVEDDGKPFNLLEKETQDNLDKPLHERTVGGLGIHFIRTMMTKVAYERTNGKNIVFLTRKY